MRRSVGVVLTVLALWYVADQLGILSITPSIKGSAGLATIFAIGLVASVSSCTALLAGLVLALSSEHAKIHAAESTHDRLRPHILFNLGRVLGFAFFGAIVGAVGSILSFSSDLNAIFVIVVALFMLALGANLLELIPRGVCPIHPPLWMARRILKLKESHHPAVPFALGALTFFLPCGFTQGVQLYALGTGDPTLAAAIMAMFALGTAPVLLGLGTATSIAHGKGLRRLTTAAGVLVMVIGIAQFQNGLTLFGLRWPDEPTVDELRVASEALTMADGKQIVQMEVTSGGFYAPDVLQVVEDVPVEWQVWGADRMGCADTLVSKGLGIYARIKPGMNTINFTPTKPGKYLFSCSMGMVRGTMIVVEN